MTRHVQQTINILIVSGIKAEQTINFSMIDFNP